MLTFYSIRTGLNSSFEADFILREDQFGSQAFFSSQGRSKVQSCRQQGCFGRGSHIYAAGYDTDSDLQFRQCAGRKKKSAAFRPTLKTPDPSYGFFPLYPVSDVPNEARLCGSAPESEGAQKAAPCFSGT